MARSVFAVVHREWKRFAFLSSSTLVSAKSVSVPRVLFLIIIYLYDERKKKKKRRLPCFRVTSSTEETREGRAAFAGYCERRRVLRLE